MSNRGLKEPQRFQRMGKGLEPIRSVLARLFFPERSVYDKLHAEWDNSDTRETFPEGGE